MAVYLSMTAQDVHSFSWPEVPDHIESALLRISHFKCLLFIVSIVIHA